MLMKKLLLFFVLVFGLQQATACCAFYYADVYPKRKDLPQNPIILLNHNIGHTKLLANAQFYLLTGEGERIEVDIIEKNTAPSYAQMVLKPTQLLNIGTKVSLNVENLSIDNEVSSNRHSSIKRFRDAIEKTWTVNAEKDNISPQYYGKISGTYNDCLMCSDSSISIHVNIPSKDIVEYKDINSNDKGWNQILVEVTDKNDYKYIVVANDNDFLLYDGICGTNYNLEPDTQYKFKFRLMDFSGNKSKRAKKFTFKTDISSIVKEQKRFEEMEREAIE